MKANQNQKKNVEKESLPTDSVRISQLNEQMPKM